MKILTRYTEYAFQALMFIGSRNVQVTAQEVSQSLNIPQPFMRRILRVLSMNHFIKSQRGQKGGFLLQKPLSEISLAEVVDVFQGSLSFTECEQLSACVYFPGCRLRDYIQDIETQVSTYLGTVTFDKLVENCKEPAEAKL